MSRFGPTFPRLFAAALLNEVSFSLLIHFPGHIDELGGSESLIGVIYAAAALVGLLLRPQLGRILDRTHRRTIILNAGLLNALIVLTLAIPGELGLMLMGLFLLQRLFQIVLFTTMLTYEADSIPVETRTQGLAMFGLAGLVPIAISGVAGDLLIDTGGFPALFVASAIAGLVSWALVWTLPVLPVLGRRPRRSFWAALLQRDLFPIWWAALCFSAGLEILFTFTRTSVVERGVGTTGLFFGVYGVTAAITRIFGGSRYDRTPQRPVMVVSLVVYGMGLLAMAFGSNVLLFAFAAFSCGLAHGALFPILTSQLVSRSRTSERGSAMAILTSVFDIALLLAAPAVGRLIDVFGYGMGFGATGVLLVVGGLLYTVWDRRLVPTPGGA